MTTEANVKIRNLPLLIDGENTSGNYLPVALNPLEGKNPSNPGGLNPVETRKATFEQVVSGGAVRANFSEVLMVSGKSVITGAAADNAVAMPPHEYGEPFQQSIIIGDQLNGFSTPISFRINNTEMMRIDAQGVSIGEDSIYFSDGNLSDERLKKNIVTISQPLKMLDEINGVNFIWSENAPESKQEKEDIGFIAQEIEKIIPSAVQENKEGHLTVSYHRVIPILVEAIKEQQEQIKLLNIRIDNLEGNK
jgi:hypothetical protein